MITTTQIAIPFHHGENGDLFTETLAVDPTLNSDDEILDITFVNFIHSDGVVLEGQYDGSEREMFLYEYRRNLRGLVIRSNLPGSKAKKKREQAILKYNLRTGKYWMTLPSFTLNDISKVTLNVRRHIPEPGLRPRPKPVKYAR